MRNCLVYDLNSFGTNSINDQKREKNDRCKGMKKSSNDWLFVARNVCHNVSIVFFVVWEFVVEIWVEESTFNRSRKGDFPVIVRVKWQPEMFSINRRTRKFDPYLGKTKYIEVFALRPICISNLTNQTYFFDFVPGHVRHWNLPVRGPHIPVSWPVDVRITCPRGSDPSSALESF